MADSEWEINKQIKQEFVSNYNGTSVWEIELVTISGPLSVLLRNMFVWWIFPAGNHLPAVIKFVLDFVMLIFPGLLGFTVFADHAPAFLTAIICACCGFFIVSDQILPAKLKNNQKDRKFSSILSLSMEGKRPFLTHYRANVNLASSIGILAVDFIIFPRRFCKAETFGTGLMDVGVGSYVLSNALVCPEARGKQQYNRSVMGKIQAVLRTFLSTWPLLLLGAARLIAVKSTDYQEHVSEYGVHWNFFFTLAAVRILSSVVFCLVSPGWSLWISVLIGFGYQYLLTYSGYTDSILHGFYGNNSRDGLLDANREGIFSCIGYLSLFMAGVKLGSYLLQCRKTVRDWCTVLMVLLLLDGCLWLAHYACTVFIQDTSRRLANLPFVLWMFCFNMSMISGFLAVEISWIIFQDVILKKSFKYQENSGFCLLEAINRNGLFYFLFANVLTGGVNFSINTISATASTGLTVVSLYMLVLCAVTSLLHVFNISLKFW